ncbi:MAG: hypothetical protein FD155_1877 [Bacteroidetes bacterium]|nr:MAG: hypothetical protein FD155_1877 [Bacteroidota bacterium]
MKIKWLVVLIPLFMLTSCFKEDEKMIPFDRGDKISSTIEMTQTYKYQVYYSFSKAQVVSSNLKMDFDLMFDNSAEGASVLLNTSNFSTAAPSGKFSFEEVTSAVGLPLTFDASSANPDSVAIGPWFQISNSDTIYSREVYVMDRGYDDLGNTLGFRKIIFDSIINNTYYFRYSLLNSTEVFSGVVKKTGSSNFSYYSFDQHVQIFPEPPKTDYDLLFTQYTTLLYTNEGDPYPYLVTGVLLNRFETEAYLDTTLVFDSITMQNIEDQFYTNKPDLIGYDWKEVLGDVNTGNVYYEIRPENNYLIRDQQGFYYKMRFIGFYNYSGEKGYPTIEFQKL